MYHYYFRRRTIDASEKLLFKQTRHISFENIKEEAKSDTTNISDGYFTDSRY